MGKKRISNQIDRIPATFRQGLRMAISIIGFFIVLIASLFLSAGEAGWWMGWLYVIMRVSLASITMLMISVKYPDLLSERFHPGSGVKAWDRPLSNISTALLPGLLIVAGLDMRFDGSPDLPLGCQLAAFLIGFLGDAFSKWAVLSNRFYSRLVRIQDDVGHSVIRDGPYRIIRHPGYAGAIVAGLASPIILDSIWALIPGGLLGLLLLVRTSLEDTFLQQELPGYAAYSKQIQYRLIPRIW